MNEKPLERLNYFNGQRLQAGDFRLEQDYHMRVRRWLNRSLYTGGIAMGLEVYAVPGRPVVKVQPGLAIDSLGREIILLEAQEVPVMHDAPGRGMKGSYLVIRYHEELLAQQDACCSPVGMNGDRPAQGGPSRVLAEPILECVADLPHEASGKVLLGRILLTPECKSIASIDTSVRRYVGEGSAAKVRQYALEGVRDIDPDNSGKVLFHIRGRQPTAVALYVRAARLPTLYYTEMGHHTHGVTVDLSLPPHVHKLVEDGSPAETGKHRVSVNGVTANTDADIWQGVIALNGIAWAAAAPGLNVAAPGAGLAAIALAAAELALLGGGVLNADRPMALALSPRPFLRFQADSLPTRVDLTVDIDADPDGHSHSIPQATRAFPENGSQSLPSGGTGTSDPAGVGGTSPVYAAHNDLPIQWVEGLQVRIDGADCTLALITQLVNRRPPSEDWSSLGNGTAAHEIAQSGTGELRLDFLEGLTLDEGEHVIEFRVPNVAGKRNGGRIHYNLYVE
jgi:hypothetical protein